MLSHLSCHLTYIWRQGLSSNLELADVARLAGQASAILLPLSSRAGIISAHCHKLFYTVTDLNTGLDAGTVSDPPTEPHLQLQTKMLQK